VLIEQCNLLQWIIIDGKIYDITKFKNLHPGGASVFFDEEIGLSLGEIYLFISSNRYPAGQDATEAFYGLHRHEVIMKPQYVRLQVGVVEGETSVIHSRVLGELSKVPYAEPTWLCDGYYSPYYTEVLNLHILHSIYVLTGSHRTTDGSRKLLANFSTNLSFLMLSCVQPFIYSRSP